MFIFIDFKVRISVDKSLIAQNSNTLCAETSVARRSALESHGFQTGEKMSPNKKESMVSEKWKRRTSRYLTKVDFLYYSRAIQMSSWMLRSLMYLNHRRIREYEFLGIMLLRFWPSGWRSSSLWFYRSSIDCRRE